MTREPAYLRGVAFCAAAGMLASFNGILFRGVESAEDWQVVFWRSGTMAVVLFALLAVRKRGRVVAAFRAAGWPAIVAGLTLGASNFTFSLAMIHTTVANALFINAGAPFLAAILSWFLLKESVAMATVVAMIVAFAGVGVMVVDGLVGGELFGNAMAVAAAITYACFAVALRGGRGADMLPAVVIGGVFSASVAFFVEQGAVFVSWHDGAMSVGMGLFTMSTSFALHGRRAVCRGGAGHTARTDGSRVRTDLGPDSIQRSSLHAVAHRWCARAFGHRRACGVEHEARGHRGPARAAAPHGLSCRASGPITASVLATGTRLMGTAENLALELPIEWPKNTEGGRARASASAAKKRR